MSKANSLDFHRIDGFFGYPVGQHVFNSQHIIKQYSKHIIKDLLKSKKTTKESIFDEKTLSIWCRGSSGSIISGLLISYLQSYFSYIYINHIKKDGENSHHGNSGFNIGKYNIIVDDMVSSGETIVEILKVIYNNIRYNQRNDFIDGLYVTGYVRMSKILEKINKTGLFIKNISASALELSTGTYNSDYCEFDYDNNLKLLMYEEDGKLTKVNNV